MTVKNKHKSEMGAHHCTRENISYTIAHLKDIEEGHKAIELQDWRTDCGIYALQMKWLLSLLDES